MSVAVFALADRLAPPSAPLGQRVLILKSLLVAFDLGTLIAILSLLRSCRLPAGLAVLYGWCPLVLKEFANSGHLDSIAVFFSTAAVAAALGAPGRVGRWGSLAAVASGSLLGLGIGAKLYPVLLVPLLTCFVAARRGVASAGWLLGASVVVSALALSPMALRGDVESSDGTAHHTPSNRHGGGGPKRGRRALSTAKPARPGRPRGLPHAVGNERLPLPDRRGKSAAP